MSEYQDWLDKIHSQFNTSPEVLSEIIKEATGSEIADLRRITAGEVNEVYDISLPSGENVIVRISRHPESEFKKEKWAIDRAEPLGVPVPHFLLIKEVELDKSKTQVCVQKKLPGEPLERGKIDYGSLPKDELRKIINQAGKILSKIHSIPTYGFEYINEKGIGSHETFKDVMSMHIDDEDEYLKVALEMKLDPGVIRDVYQILSSKIKDAPDFDPVLNHNDFGPKHIMIDQGKVSGILDWGTVAGHSPLNDFAKWVFWYEDIPVEWLQEGYTNKKIFDTGYKDLMYWILLNNSLSGLWWYYESGYQAGAEDIIRRVKKALKHF